jgi:hypothetical protein
VVEDANGWALLDPWHVQLIERRPSPLETNLLPVPNGANQYWKACLNRFDSQKPTERPGLLNSG